MTRAVAITLKIPDNTAYTAGVALRRLGVAVERIERSAMWLLDDDGDLRRLTERITADETIFNPTTQRLTVLEQARPRSGEVWIERLEPLERAPGAIAWRLFDSDGTPLRRGEVGAAVDRLLCNPAIERAVY